MYQKRLKDGETAEYLLRARHFTAELNAADADDSEVANDKRRATKVDADPQKQIACRDR